MNNAAKVCAFRAWPEIQERLEFEEKIGINMSGLINKLLADHLKPSLEKKVKAVAAPVP